MAYATASNVEVELGRPASSPAETAQWSAWLERVERSIERGFRRAGLTLADSVAADDPSSQDVIDVEVGAVIRKIQNPTWGQTSNTSTRSIDDGSITNTSRREGGESGVDPLSLTPWEWNNLLPGSESAGFSTRPGFEPDRPAYVTDWS